MHRRVWKLQKFSLTRFSQKFRKSNGFTYLRNYLTVDLTKFFFSKREFLVFPHCALFSWNQSNENVNFTEIVSNNRSLENISYVPLLETLFSFSREFTIPSLFWMIAEAYFSPLIALLRMCLFDVKCANNIWSWIPI